MRRVRYGLIYLLMFCVPFTSYASFKPVDLNPRIKSGQLVQIANNIIVLIDKSASMGEMDGKPMVNEATRLSHAKDAVKNMITALPEVKLYVGLRTFSNEETPLLSGVKSLDKKDYTKAIDSIENPNHRSNMGKAITAAGNDIESTEGHSALIIVSDFSETPGIDDINPATVMDAITKVNAKLGDRLCVYAVQVGYVPDGKALSEQIVQNVKGGYTVNADKLATPAAMSDFVQKVISGNCSRYTELFAKPKEQVIILISEPNIEKKVAVALSDTKNKEKVIILAFEDINFDFNKSTLTPQAQKILKKNVRRLKDNPNAKVRIAVYSSASGTHAYKQKLGNSRANAVQKYLIKEGVIKRGRISTIAYGETNPTMYDAAPKEIYSKAARTNVNVLFELIVQ